MEIQKSCPRVKKRKTVKGAKTLPRSKWGEEQFINQKNFWPLIKCIRKVFLLSKIVKSYPVVVLAKPNILYIPLISHLRHTQTDKPPVNGTAGQELGLSSRKLSGGN